MAHCHSWICPVCQAVVCYSLLFQVQASAAKWRLLRFGGGGSRCSTDSNQLTLQGARCLHDCEASIIGRGQEWPQHGVL